MFVADGDPDHVFQLILVLRTGPGTGRAVNAICQNVVFGLLHCLFEAVIRWRYDHVYAQDDCIALWMTRCAVWVSLVPRSASSIRRSVRWLDDAAVTAVAGIALTGRSHSCRIRLSDGVVAGVAVSAGGLRVGGVEDWVGGDEAASC